MFLFLQNLTTLNTQDIHIYILSQKLMRFRKRERKVGKEERGKERGEREH